MQWQFISATIGYQDVFQKFWHSTMNTEFLSENIYSELWHMVNYFLIIFTEMKRSYRINIMQCKYIKQVETSEISRNLSIIWWITRFVRNCSYLTLKFCTDVWCTNIALIFKQILTPSFIYNFIYVIFTLIHTFSFHMLDSIVCVII